MPTRRSAPLATNGQQAGGRRRIVITGGPGAGKTTLLSELSARGQATVPESARRIIASRVARGLAPRPEPAAFAREILCSDIEQYENPPPGDGPIFHDRSAVEALGMVQDAEPLPADALQSMLSRYAYDGTVFVLPPWQAIYVNDAERDHSFDHAVAVHARLVRWYTRCGYRLHEVPRLPVAQRAAHILAAVGAEAPE